MFHVKHGNGLGLIVSRETWKSPFCQNGSTLPAVLPTVLPYPLDVHDRITF